MRFSPRPLLAVLTAAAVLVPAVATLDSASAAPASGADDAVVIAVLDSGMSPYHEDFRAARMPQARTASARDDLPLSRPPHTWIKGFPSPTSFESYGPTRITLPSGSRDMAELQKQDADAWSDVEQSKPAKLAYTWFPGTKVIGALSFSSTRPRIYGVGATEHGQGTTSVSVGNQHGSCPECVLVFLQTPDAASYEAAISWVQNQPWIDAISVSLGFNASGAVRDRYYEGSDVRLARRAVERGQTHFFSGGNGLDNAFVAPQTTLLNSQNGPDWAIAVGAVAPSGANFSGNGKPTRIASLGYDYPSAYNSASTTGSGSFSGTSNATPVIAGTYGRALWFARNALAGPSKVQSKGVIARGPRVACGAARKSCEIGDGLLTRRELLERLFKGATPSTVGTTPFGAVGLTAVAVPHTRDERFASEGHGVYRARMDGNADWQAEFDNRLWGVLSGRRAAPARPSGEVDWFRVESYCRQRYWGSWSQGWYLNDTTTALPAPDPANWPTRTALQEGCPERSGDG